MAEELSDYLAKAGARVRYLHSEIDTLARTEILRQLRADEFDVLVGINLLREGLDLPEVELVAILDADKEGFLRTERSLIQTIGRAARNDKGRVILYGDKITDAMRKAIDVTHARRAKQEEYNKAHGITPVTIIKAVPDAPATERADGDTTGELGAALRGKSLEDQLKILEFEMQLAADSLDFERAIVLRDRVAVMQKKLKR